MKEHLIYSLLIKNSPSLYTKENIWTCMYTTPEHQRDLVSYPHSHMLWYCTTWTVNSSEKSRREFHQCHLHWPPAGTERNHSLSSFCFSVSWNSLSQRGNPYLLLTEKPASDRLFIWSQSCPALRAFFTLCQMVKWKDLHSKPVSPSVSTS